MRKQTKLVAVLSTAALLALGASMSSFAATGWQEENGTWVYYDKSGDKETEKWEKSGDNWFYLNDDGEMATDVIVEYNDNYYYVDDNGSMVTNKWVSIENENYDGDNEDEPVNHWYYFGANGKAYKSSSTSSTASFKTINGKKYLFDDEGKMLFGWIGSDGERKTGDTAWQEGDYYCGDENDGAQAAGWAYLDIVDSDYTEDEAGKSSSNVFDDENQTRWFYFKSNGKKMTEEKGKTINGKKYSFDEYGRMNAEWVIYDATPTTAKTATGSITATQGSADYTKNWRYYGTPEDGARVTKGWFKVVPDENLYEDKYNDDEDSWYYSDKDGKLVASEIKTINGKKYLFDEYGRMKDGLKFIKFETGSTTNVDAIASDDTFSDKKFDTEDNFKENANELLDMGYLCYYFGSGDDGSMKTNKQNVSIDGESLGFLFNKSGSYKGAGKNGVDNKKYYMAGMLLSADKDDKYAVIKIDESGTAPRYSILTTDEFKDESYVSPAAVPTGKDYTEYYTVNNTAAETAKISYKLVNTSGSVQKSKSKAKDGNDRCYNLTGEKINYIYVED
ncbi:cell wall-binding protein [Lacrimispora amygdalina]|uniref:Cell wall-binding protein n=1 Tax=Lacrimispora amygdalina TaxID=253257 RepID=A0A3E2N4U0_9FIRM|nr:cell wall-binding protein [Clostridium indicum]RFZ75992.1 cell wall-binding protein [Clostridium indicum]